jgi:lipopolysaccharide export system permease protein
MGFEIPFLLALILPLGMYLGIIFTYGRLYADNELRVMNAYGLSTKQLFVITGSFGCMITIIVAVLMLWVNPLIASEKNKLIAKSMATENILDSLIPGRFQLSTGDKRVLYVESISRNHKHANNIFIAEQKEHTDRENTWAILSAKEGHQVRDAETKDRYVVATDGYRYEGTPGENAYKIIQFQKYAVRIIEQVMGLKHEPQEMMPTQTLIQDYSKNPKNAAELQWRFAIPISALLLVFLAIPLSYAKPRQSRYSNVFPALLIYVVYMNLLFLTRDWISSKTISPSIGMWWVHGLLFSMIILICMLSSQKRSPFRFFSTKKISEVT